MHGKIACTLHDVQPKVLQESNFQVTGNSTEKFMKKQELPDSQEGHISFSGPSSARCLAWTQLGAAPGCPCGSCPQQEQQMEGASLKVPIQELRNKGKKSVWRTTKQWWLKINVIRNRSPEPVRKGRQWFPDPGRQPLSSPTFQNSFDIAAHKLITKKKIKNELC